MGYGANYSSGYCYLGVERFDQRSTMGMLMEATSLFISLLFRNWSFRKIYADVAEFNFEQFASGEHEFFRVVAEVPEKEFFDGRYFAVKTVEFDRAQWSIAMERIEPLLGVRWS
jgi:hypothetical protein